MPVREMTVVPETYPEAVDVVASASMKQPHKKYGSYIKRLSAIIKQVVNPGKGEWQPWFTIGTRVFGLAYRGHNTETCTALARAIAEEMGVDVGKAEELAKVIVENKSYIVGEKARPGASEEAF